jgi:hypothetical protein
MFVPFYDSGYGFVEKPIGAVYLQSKIDDRPIGRDEVQSMEKICGLIGSLCLKC